MKTRELLAQKAAKIEEARALNNQAETEGRDLTADEQTRWDAIQGEIETLTNRIDRSQKLEAEPKVSAVPAHLKFKRGDSFESGMAAYLRTGDRGGVRELLTETDGGEGVQIRASNATDMNIGTAADGGDLVPTGFYNQIIAQRSEASLPDKLGVMRIPGRGTTIDVPYDNEADGEFVSTSEAGNYDLDAPAVSKRQMTLVTYTKYLTLSNQLLRDEDASLMSFLASWIARGQAKTYNQLLLTEVGTTGTAYKVAASSTAIAAGEIEATALNDTVGDYLDDSKSVAFVMRPSTFSAIASITGNARLYAATPGGDMGGKNLLGYPVHFSNKAAAIASAAKVAYFGNWNFVGMREGDGLNILRDPYSAAYTGQVKIWLRFDCVFKQLQAGAVGYLRMLT
jgi:HK97 family phage major capsid protein